MSDIIRLHQPRSRPFIWRPELSGYLATPHEFCADDRGGRRVSCIRASSLLPVRVKVRTCARARDNVAVTASADTRLLLSTRNRYISRTSAMEKRGGLMSRAARYIIIINRARARDTVIPAVIYRAAKHGVGLDIN